MTYQLKTTPLWKRVQERFHEARFDTPLREFDIKAAVHGSKGEVHHAKTAKWAWGGAKDHFLKALPDGVVLGPGQIMRSEKRNLSAPRAFALGLAVGLVVDAIEVIPQFLAGVVYTAKAAFHGVAALFTSNPRDADLAATARGVRNLRS